MTNLRPATFDDIDLINQMAQVTFIAAYGEILSPEQIDYMMDMMYSRENIVSHMTKEKYHYFIASADDGTPSAYLSIQELGDNNFCLQRLYVMPEYKRRGIGSALIDFSFDYVKGLAGGAPCRIELHVNRNNLTAQKLYSKKGFFVDYSKKFDIGGGFIMDDHIMAKML